MEEPPPFLGTWKRIYVSVAVYLVCIIALFWVFGRAFRP